MSTENVISAGTPDNKTVAAAGTGTIETPAGTINAAGAVAAATSAAPLVSQESSIPKDDAMAVFSDDEKTAVVAPKPVTLTLTPEQVLKIGEQIEVTKSSPKEDISPLEPAPGTQITASDKSAQVAAAGTIDATTPDGTQVKGAAALAASGEKTAISALPTPETIVGNITGPSNTSPDLKTLTNSKGVGLSQGA